MAGEAFAFFSADFKYPRVFVPSSYVNSFPWIPRGFSFVGEKTIEVPTCPLWFLRKIQSSPMLEALKEDRGDRLEVEPDV